MEHLAIDMIGEMIGEMTGKVMGQRIVRHHGGETMIERTFEMKGKVLGVDARPFLPRYCWSDRPQGGTFSKVTGS